MKYSGTFWYESLMTGGQQWAIFAAISSGQLLVPDAAGTYIPLHSFPTGEWHHLRLDFAGPGQTYLGLGANQYRLFLDQEDLGTFSASIDLSLDFFVLIVQNVAGTGVGQLYVDAVGFSWDPNYAIGQNLVVSGPPATPVLTLDVGEPGATMTWAPKDASYEATSYSLYVDGILSTSGTWTYGSRISLDLSILAPGEHFLSAVFDDGIGGITTSSIIVRVVGLQESLLEEIDAIIAVIQSSSDADWRCPASNHKGAMIEKLEEVKDLIAAGNYAEAYDKLLHDIKPKLTGLKTDENEIPWGNGVFNNPWVTSSALQQVFKNLVNPILKGMQLLE